MVLVHTGARIFGPVVTLSGLKTAKLYGFLGQMRDTLAQNGLKMGGTHLFGNPKCSKATCGKNRF